MQVNNLKEVTPESQREHIKKIKAILKTLPGEGTYFLTEGEVETITRALACHMFVIELDLKRQEEKNGKSNRDQTAKSD